MANKLSFEIIVRFLKEHGYLFESGKIYSGLASSYDYGPLGLDLKQKIKKMWWKNFVSHRKNIYGIESSVLTEKTILDASGHLEKFIDQVIKCLACQKEFKLELIMPEIIFENISVDNDSNIKEKIKEKKINCPNCQAVDNFDFYKYNLLFETWHGSKKEVARKVYLRPETAQGIFTNFLKIKNALKLTLPFGIAQIGKVFRNELTTKHANFRTCEFEQMEIEFFYLDQKEEEKWFSYWKNNTAKFINDVLQINEKNIRTHFHNNFELAHYSKKTIDFEYRFPFGWKEIWGLSNRGNYDLTAHQNKSKTDMTVINEKQEKIIPMVIEPSVGVERLMLAMVCEHLQINNDKFTFSLPFVFCYYQIAILPLVENLAKPSKKIVQLLENDYKIRFDSKKSIGRRYLFHDAIGTFFCITFDFQSLNDNKVTVRNRDTKIQTRVAIEDLKKYLNNEITINSRTDWKKT